MDRFFKSAFYVFISTILVFSLTFFLLYMYICGHSSVLCSQRVGADSDADRSDSHPGCWAQEETHQQR